MEGSSGFVCVEGEGCVLHRKGRVRWGELTILYNTTERVWVNLFCL